MMTSTRTAAAVVAAAPAAGEMSTQTASHSLAGVITIAGWVFIGSRGYFVSVV